MSQKERAEALLKGMLLASEIPVKGSYAPYEVCAVFGFVERTFWRLLAQYEIDEDGILARPDCLNSFQLRRHRRVAYPELIAFLSRNNSYQRQNAAHPDQMGLFDTD